MHSNAEERQYSLLATWVYVAIGLASLLCLALGEQLQHSSHDWGVFVKEIGFAGLISLILVFTIEKFTRGRHERAADKMVEKINFNLFHAIYKRHIPNETMAALEKTLFRSGVFRRQHELHYDIVSLPQNADMKCEKHVKCTASSRYKLENVTDSNITHSVVLTIERPIDSELEALCKIESVQIGSDNLTRQQIDAATSKTDAQIVFSHPIFLKSRQSVVIQSTAVLVKRKTDQEIWSSRIPSDGIKLTVSVPGKDLKVLANALHHEPLESLLSNESSSSWELRHGTFPFQSIVFWWSGKDPLTCPFN